METICGSICLNLHAQGILHKEFHPCLQSNQLVHEVRTLPTSNQSIWIRRKRSNHRLKVAYIYMFLRKEESQKPWHRESKHTFFAAVLKASRCGISGFAALIRCISSLLDVSNFNNYELNLLIYELNFSLMNKRVNFR